MPQAFHILRCGDCETFQVLQVTKTNKWKCKLCGRKQSIVKIFGTGTGGDCRRHVQKLNHLRGERDQTREDSRLSNLDGECPVSHTEFGSTSSENYDHLDVHQPSLKGSRWSSYLESHTDHDEEKPGSGIGVSKCWSAGETSVTTDWTEYQESRRNMSKKRRIDMHMEFRELPTGKMCNVTPDDHQVFKDPDDGKESVSTLNQIQTFRCGNGQDGEQDFAIELSPFSGRKHFPFHNKKNRHKSIALDSNSSGRQIQYESDNSRSDSFSFRKKVTNTTVTPDCTGGSLSCVEKQDNIQGNDVNNTAQNLCVKNGLNKVLATGDNSLMLNKSNKKCPIQPVPTSSKWGAFIELEENSDDGDSEDDELGGDVRGPLVLSHPSFSVANGPNAELKAPVQDEVTTVNLRTFLSVSHSTDNTAAVVEKGRNAFQLEFLPDEAAQDF